LSAVFLAAAVTGAAAFTMAGAAAAARPDAPDQAQTWLRSPAHTLHDLVQEVRHDPAARARYAHFFRVSEDQTVPYLKYRLTPAVTAVRAPYTVYFLSQDGTVYPVWLTLPAGTRVFVNAHHIPVLLCNTGDPLTPPLWAMPHPAKPVTPKLSITASALPTHP
jgi:hypothetical protein